MTKQELKDKLLNTAYFINNKYLDQYIQLVYNYNTDEAYTEKHHILQRCYYKYSNIPIDNDENNIVRLAYKDHCKAHWLLYFCTIGYLKQANEASVRYISEMYKKLTGKEKHKFDFVQDDFELLQKYMNDIIQDKDSKYWSTDEIQFLKDNYGEYGSGLYCAKVLNKTIRQVNKKAKQLGIANNYPDWTEEELNILYQFYPSEGSNVYLRIPKHSQGACINKAVQLKIKTQNHYWTEEDIKKFINNAEKPLTEIVKLFPGRTYSSIKHYWQRNIREQLINGKDNDRR